MFKTPAVFDHIAKDHILAEERTVTEISAKIEFHEELCLCMACAF